MLGPLILSVPITVPFPDSDFNNTKLVLFLHNISNIVYLKVYIKCTQAHSYHQGWEAQPTLPRLLPHVNVFPCTCKIDIALNLTALFKYIYFLHSAYPSVFSGLQVCYLNRHVAYSQSILIL